MAFLSAVRGEDTLRGELEGEGEKGSEGKPGRLERSSKLAEGWGGRSPKKSIRCWSAVSISDSGLSVMGSGEKEREPDRPWWEGSNRKEPLDEGGASNRDTNVSGIKKDSAGWPPRSRQP